MSQSSVLDSNGATSFLHEERIGAKPIYHTAEKKRVTPNGVLERLRSKLVCFADTQLHVAPVPE